MTTTRNPFYLLLVLGSVSLVYWRAARAARARDDYAVNVPAQLLHPLRFGMLVMIIAPLYNFFTVHAGAHIVWRLPYWLPLLGGPLTLEGLLFGAITGLLLTGLFTAFGVINLVLTVRSLVRLIPRAYYPVAVVVSIAVTFVPSTLYQLQQIREAQAVRGHKLDGLRALLPLWMPLLAGGMERALQLAESMTARGFAGERIEPQNSPLMARVQIQWGLMGSLLILTTGWLLRLAFGWRMVGMWLMIGASAAAILLLWQAGRAQPHTVYRPEPWTRPSLLVMSGALITLILFAVPLPGLIRDSIYYLPYPRLSWPDVHWAIGLGTLGLLTPAFFITKP